MKIANIDKENLDNFWKTWKTSMKLSGKTSLMIILKVTKSQGFTISLSDTFFKKPQGAESNWPPPPQAVLRLKIKKYQITKDFWGKKNMKSYFNCFYTTEQALYTNENLKTFKHRNQYKQLGNKNKNKIRFKRRK